MVSPSLLVAELGPTNTGKTWRAIERMLEHESGMMGFPLRLLAREVYDRITAKVGATRVALITGEEKRVPASPAYWVCTVEAMPLDQPVDFLAVDEIQLCAHRERGHVFTDRLLHARGRRETWFLGSEAMRPVLRELLPGVTFRRSERLSQLRSFGTKSLKSLPPRSAVVAFSIDRVYELAQSLRELRGGVAVVLGALSPRTRNAQVAMYQAGEVQYLVATDAIGMGLNLDLERIAFASLSKFDGFEQRDLHRRRARADRRSRRRALINHKEVFSPLWHHSDPARLTGLVDTCMVRMSFKRGATILRASQLLACAVFASLTACSQSESQVGATKQFVVSEEHSQHAFGGCYSESPHIWLSQFHGDSAFFGLALAPDGRSARLLHTGGQDDFERLAPYAREALRGVNQAVYTLESSTIDIVPMADAELVDVPVSYSLSELLTLEETVCASISEREDSLALFIDFEANRLVVTGAYDSNDDRIVIRESRQYEPMSTLRDHRRPILAGTQSLYAGMNSNTETCTIGFVGMFGLQKRIVTASHCSPTIFGIAWPNPELRQNGWTLFDGIGTETTDPGPSCGTMCRNSDSTASSAAFASQTVFGAIAVPTLLSNLVNPACLNNGACSQTDYGATISLQIGAPLALNQNIERIGRPADELLALTPERC